MSIDRVLSMLLTSLALAAVVSAHGADLSGPRPRVVDPARAKAQEADRQRLVAKLHGDAPKVEEPPAPRNPLDAPIFHRYDRR
ncbi:MAG: hypothetical protein ABI520_14085 [Caldimonas sp.]